MYYAALARLPGFVETASERWLKSVFVALAVVIFFVSAVFNGIVMAWIHRADVVILFLFFSLWIIRRFLRKLEKIQREREEQAGLSATVDDDG
jgi:predicted membrane protein